MYPGRFVGELTLTWVNPEWWRINQDPACPFAYITSYGRRIQPRDGRLTDLGSIPWIATNFLPRQQFALAYVCHDDDYDLKVVPRLQADTDLDEMIYTMMMNGYKVRREIVWVFVRGFGWIRWNRASSAIRAAKYMALKQHENKC